MPGYKRYIGAGILVGAAATAAYVAGRRFGETTPELVNWSRVRHVALNSARHSVATIDSTARATLAAQYAGRVRRSEALIAGYIGRDLPRPLEHVHVFDRGEWIDANIANFELLFEPFEHVNRQVLGGTSAGTRIFGGVNQFFLSSQLGVLLGYLGQRVLGQYDLALLGREPLTSGRLYFVEPNIAQLEQRLHLQPEEFRLWIALHETTHAYEFEANLWLRGYMNALIGRYFSTVSSDLLGFNMDRHAVASLLWRVAENAFQSRYVIEWVMTAEQRAIFRQMQALMCLLEGYSNHVMQQVGEVLLPSYKAMKARFEERAKDRPPVERIFTKLIGMDLKYEQYALGERFVGAVVANRGIAFMNRVWGAPEYLPTLEEIRVPDQWIARVSAA